MSKSSVTVKYSLTDEEVTQAIANYVAERKNLPNGDVRTYFIWDFDKINSKVNVEATLVYK